MISIRTVAGLLLVDEDGDQRQLLFYLLRARQLLSKEGGNLKDRRFI